MDSMAKASIPAATVRAQTHVARDAHRASVKVQRAVDRRAKKATLETAAIKAKRTAA
jgi:hypothetical protein